MKIFFGDLVHTWDKKSIWTFPLNVGYVASYAKKYLDKAGINCDIKIFKDPEKMINDIKKEKPHVVALSYYQWNSELNRKVHDVVRTNVPNALNVGGGPNITSLNANEKGALKFFSSQKNCDAFVVNQGEKGFVELIKKFSEVNRNLGELRSTAVPGSLINDLKKNNKVYVGEDIGALSDLNDIPSPYLNGLMDPFFEETYIPVLETNRSCPYRCTFCAWGIGTVKLAKFDNERVIDEIEYISKRCKLTTTLMIADANFGILERDSKLAAKMYECHKKYGFPSFAWAQWNKTRSDRIIKTARELKEIGVVGASMQSLNEDVLLAVKRKNFTLEEVVKMKEELGRAGLKRTGTELIIGLPCETKESHLDANRKLIDLEMEITAYNLHMLPGTEMDGEEYRKKYFKKMGWRLHDNCYGIYEGEKVLELQETVLETHTLSVEDFRYFRYYHFLQYMMWSKKWYYDYLKFLKSYDIHPVDVFDKIITKCKKDNGVIGNLYLEFMRDYNAAESFESAEELKSYWEKDENFDRLKNQDYGKLNMLYMYKTIIDNRHAFTNFLLDISKDYALSLDLDSNSFVDACEEVLKFQNSKFIQIDDEWKIKEQLIETFNYDVLEWTKNGYGQLKKSENQNKYKFHLLKEQSKTLNTQLKQYKNKSINFALKNMTIYTDAQQFFYNVKPEMIS
jgi:radical SAM superfamily enzyme YgiQ (UPF0313 family)